MSRLKPRPTKLAEVEVPEIIVPEAAVPEVMKEEASVKASEMFVGRGVSRDISSDLFDGALAPEAPKVIGPKRRESRTAMGRAPIVKMSRRIPPTPVAAPWNGSMKLGWLCDSILKAMT